jgi:glycosyltransferase involved in cell wall biosynthesis
MQLAIVVPCYNEEETLHESAARLLNIMAELEQKGKVSENSRIYFVDDGSEDSTWTGIESLVQGNNRITGIRLSRNRGHQNALIAGLFTAEGDAIVTIDADLQDDINVMENMVDEFIKGKDIVYGVREKRESDTAFKRITAEGFYRFMGFMGVNLIYNHADYRLMSRRAIDALKEFREVNLFLRGIVPLIGFASSTVYYHRAKRLKGSTKYPLSKMLAFAIDGITSFSTAPLRLITLTGSIVFTFSLLISAWAFWVKFFTDRAIPGWASTVLPIYFIGGIQVICIGIIGEYLSKIYTEIKGRPKYFIDKIISGPGR